MTIEGDREAALSQSDIVKILRICMPDGLLVGGQALAFWADRLSVARPAELISEITSDADFIGDASLARKLGQQLGWKTWIPALDDATSQTGKVTHRLANGKVKQVDFLSGVVGLTTKDLLRRAVELEVPEIGVLRVLHPIDVLDSRIQNLHSLPGKRNAAGRAQAALATDVVRAYIRVEIETRGERAALKLLERVVEIAGDISAIKVFLLYAIDPLNAVPVESFTMTPSLHSTRWPQLTTLINKKRGSQRKLLLNRHKSAK